MILAPGLGVAAASFASHSVPTNLTDFLMDHGYDVWLFDYRASPALPAARLPFNVDDIARRDWPAAVRAVQHASGAASVQVVAHCVGSMSLLMAILAGLGGVRAAVCSQLGLHPSAGRLTNRKCHLPLASALRRLGLGTLTTEVGSSGGERALDAALRLNPDLAGERCESPVCRRIFGLYGPSYRHAQLNAATHEEMSSWFGTVNVTALEHVARTVRHGAAVDRDGNDVYLPHLRRLALPIRFLAGQHNQLFVPDATARTLDVLASANGAHLYDRRVIPGYAHMDCLVGRNAARDVYPLVLEHLEATSTELREAG